MRSAVNYHACSRVTVIRIVRVPIFFLSAADNWFLLSHIISSHRPRRTKPREQEQGQVRPWRIYMMVTELVRLYRDWLLRACCYLEPVYQYRAFSGGLRARMHVVFYENVMPYCAIIDVWCCGIDISTPMRGALLRALASLLVPSS